jgi:CO/xanthine dehydrogenase Mo-binding subunit
VAAASDEIARDALDLIRVEYEELPAILTPEEAMDEEAFGIHPGRNNVAQHIQFERGDVEAGFAAADLIHEATYTTHSQYPGYMEPMATVASLDPDGRLVLYTSTQAVNLVRMQVAMTLGLPISRARDSGRDRGGFGGKIVEDDNQLLAGLLACIPGVRCGWSTTGWRTSRPHVPACPSASPQAGHAQGRQHCRQAGSHHCRMRCICRPCR